jgi:tRNA modification GTPase
MTQTDTIFAPASGHGTAGITVIRVSGPDADSVLQRLTGLEPPPARQARLCRLYDAAGGELDRALVIRFEAGASYTGEAVVELHCHGGRAVQLAVLRELSLQPGCRLAEAGEFTRRAFLAGRMDLADVEALGDLLAAETELQRRQAMRGLGGALQRQAGAWREKLVRAAALIEATIDWADEEVPEDVGPEVKDLVREVRDRLQHEVGLSAGAELLRTGLEVALCGAPNAGKSSILNALAGRDAAITSAIPGTTRDVLELRYDLGGLPIVFLDTAGLRDAADEVERIGVARAEARAEAATMRLFLRSADVPPALEEARLWRPGDLRVWSKADLGTGEADLAVSAKTGAGMTELLGRIRSALADRVAGDGLAGHLRQRQALESAVDALDDALQALEDGCAELAAENLRAAFRDLERLLGRVSVEQVLDAVFSAFCLGK